MTSLKILVITSPKFFQRFREPITDDFFKFVMPIAQDHPEFSFYKAKLGVTL